MCPLPAMTPPASIASTATSHAQGTEAGRTGDAPLARRTSDSTYAGIPISADNVRSRMREVAGDESQRRRRRRWRGQPRRRHRSTRSSRASAKKTMFAAGCSSPTLLALFLRLLARRRAAPAGGRLCDLARHLDGLLGDTQGITGGLLHRPGQLDLTGHLAGLLPDLFAYRLFLTHGIHPSWHLATLRRRTDSPRPVRPSEALAVPDANQ